MSIRVDFNFWLKQPHSQRHQTDQMLSGQIKQFWLESGCVYGYRKCVIPDSSAE